MVGGLDDYIVNINERISARGKNLIHDSLESTWCVPQAERHSDAETRKRQVEPQGEYNKRRKTEQGSKTGKTEWKVSGVTIKLRFDSGSDISFANPLLIDKLKEHGVLINDAGKEIRTASGSIEKSMRSATVLVSDGAGTEISTTIYELPGATANSLYLGRDILKKYNILVDFGTRRFRLGRKWLDM